MLGLSSSRNEVLYQAIGYSIEELLTEYSSHVNSVDVDSAIVRSVSCLMDRFNLKDWEFVQDEASLSGLSVLACESMSCESQHQIHAAVVWLTYLLINDDAYETEAESHLLVERAKTALLAVFSEVYGTDVRPRIEEAIKDLDCGIELERDLFNGEKLKIHSELREVPDVVVQGYLKAKVHFGTTRTHLRLLEIRYGLPDMALERAPYTEIIFRLIAEVVILINDIVSMKIEESNGSLSNSVLLLKHTGVEGDEAEKIVLDYCLTNLAFIREVMKKMFQSGWASNHVVELPALITLLKLPMLTYSWSSSSGRY